jgi:hypothetical protein
VTAADDLIQTYASLLPRGPIPSRLEAGTLAIERLKAIAPTASSPGASPVPLLGIPVAPLDDPDPWAWRMLDQHGEVMHEGRFDVRLGEEPAP